MASVYGLKPYPFYLGIGFVAIGTLLSTIIVRDTKQFMLLETRNHEKGTGKNNDDNANANENDDGRLTFKQVFAYTSWQNRTLLSVSQAGLVSNLVFGVSWGLFTLYFASFNLNINEIEFLKALHPAVWGVLQLGTGSLSDKVGRKVLIYSCMMVQAAGIWVVLFSDSTFGWIAGMSLLGAGTALVIPPCLPRLAMSRIQIGGQHRLVFIGFGETSVLSLEQ